MRHHALRRGLVVCAVVASVCGTIGYQQSETAAHREPNLWNALYLTVQLFALHAPHFEGPLPWTLELARWLAPTTFLLGLFEAVRGVLRQESSHRALSRLHGHAVICGLGQKGLELACHLGDGRSAPGWAGVVVIDQAPRPDLVVECERAGAIVITGDATRPDTLGEARVEQAARLFAVCPEDATNCEIAAQVSHLRAARGGAALECIVHVSRAELREALRQTLPALANAGSIQPRFVDAFDPEALDLILYGLPLDHGGIGPKDPRAAHLIILGLGRMGRALALRAAQLGVFANEKRLRISVIDRRAETHQAELLFRHPEMAAVADLQFHPIEATSPEARHLIQGWCSDPNTLPSIAICYGDESVALEIALRLLPLFALNETRIAVRMSRQTGMAHLLGLLRAQPAKAEAAATPSTADASGESLRLRRALSRLHPFGMEERFARLADADAESVENAAQGIHRAYVELTLRHLREADGDVAAAKANPELQDWSGLSEDLRESNRQQAAHLVFKLRAIGREMVPAEANRPAVEKFTTDELELLAKMEHARWVVERKIAGWTLGERKHIERRESPSLVPWEQLPAAIREYDRAAILRIPALLRAIGKKICRL